MKTQSLKDFFKTDDQRLQIAFDAWRNIQHHEIDETDAETSKEIGIHDLYKRMFCAWDDTFLLQSVWSAWQFMHICELNRKLKAELKDAAAHRPMNQRLP